MSSSTYDIGPAIPRMELWDAVCETDPAITKRVNKHGGFTAIDAYSQIRTATQQFGPFGIGWGVSSEDFRVIETKNTHLVIYQATLWYMYHGARGQIPLHSCKTLANGRNDEDAVKKVATDAITKGLSKLGFNADIFLGKFDDNKYVDSMRKKFKKQENWAEDAYILAMKELVDSIGRSRAIGVSQLMSTSKVPTEVEKPLIIQTAKAIVAAGGKVPSSPVVIPTHIPASEADDFVEAWRAKLNV